MYFTDANIDFAHANSIPVLPWSVGRDCSGKVIRGERTVDVKAALKSVDAAKFEALVVDALTAADVGIVRVCGCEGGGR